MLPGPSLLEELEVAAGTVTGGDHLAAGRGGQDGFCWAGAPDLLAAVVCDGCGSGRCSEVGARLGARMLVASLMRRGRELGDQPATLLEQVESDLLLELGRIAQATCAPQAPAAAPGARELVIADYLLFTAVGAVVTPGRTLLFAGGDGIVAVDGAVRILEAPDNAPAYVGYGLLGRPAPLALLADLPTGDVGTILLGTDGLHPLASGSAPAPRLSELWSDDRLFGNPRSLERRLRLWNRGRTTIDWEARAVRREPPLFHDDATAIVLRRRRHGRDAEAAR